LLWKNLKDSYDDQKIIVFSWFSSLLFLIFGRMVYGLVNWGIWNNDLIDWISVFNKPGISYIGGYLGLIFSVWLFSKKEQWKFINFMEDTIRPFLIMSSFFMLDEFFRTKFNLEPFIYFSLMLLIFIFSGWIANKYRSFVWYKSGKKGFVLLSSNFLFFLAVVPALILFKENIINIVLASIISLISLIGLFILGRVKYERK
jgi:hypothetical protein